MASAAVLVLLSPGSHSSGLGAREVGEGRPSLTIETILGWEEGRRRVMHPGPASLAPMSFYEQRALQGLGLGRVPEGGFLLRLVFFVFQDGRVRPTWGRNWEPGLGCPSVGWILSAHSWIKCLPGDRCCGFRGEKERYGPALSDLHIRTCFYHGLSKGVGSSHRRWLCSCCVSRIPGPILSLEPGRLWTLATVTQGAAFCGFLEPWAIS